VNHTEQFGDFAENSRVIYAYRLAAAEFGAYGAQNCRTPTAGAAASSSLDGPDCFSAGIVARTPHPTDNRKILISLTPAGLDMIERLAPIAWERQKRLLSGLSQQDAFRVIEILERNADDLLRNP
jgi:hypothetical protein